jgi:hypothetical protein
MFEFLEAGVQSRDLICQMVDEGGLVCLLVGITCHSEAELK